MDTASFCAMHAHFSTCDASVAISLLFPEVALVDLVVSFFDVGVSKLAQKYSELRRVLCRCLDPSKNLAKI